ncbi:MAG TPA: type II secretion system minor pseudopilin GspI [Woeseiaceae bacterium]|nr:type II secretion system minor pseudopilin GspI [Woeseiaceae bacterium]
MAEPAARRVVPIRPGRAAQRQRGFTLVEVMVALVIIAISLTTMAVTMGRMLTNASTLRDRTFASWIAQNKIVEMRAAGTIPKTGITSGEIDYAESEWAWSATVSETGVENLFRVDVSISRPGVEGRIKSVTGFIGEPVAPGAGNRIWTQGMPGTGDTRS